MNCTVSNCTHSFPSNVLDALLAKLSQQPDGQKIFADDAQMHVATDISDSEEHKIAVSCNSATQYPRIFAKSKLTTSGTWYEAK
ncbi:hypothetical protein [Vibrio rotiferianus]|uniref:hypothetical protein n=1 Tax=Vibrio rotiferianus TaxID=190895 RepID=UPI00148B5207|nr:hypothetical protein [Vibrio rotiferianus]NOH67067.1 hypothetical protein [Vibrio rotiferianus]